MSWTCDPLVLRHEQHFDDRVLRCLTPRPASPWQAFCQAVAARPTAEALVCGDERLSYAALDARVARTAAALAAQGLGAGDRVAMLLANRSEFVTVLLASWRLRAIVVPMGTRLQTPEIAYIVNHSGAKLLVHDEALAPRLPPPTETPSLHGRIAVGPPSPALEAAGAAPCEPPTPMARGEPEAEESVAAILYTSGTTGRPKGAMLTQLNLVHTMLNYVHSMQLGPADRTLMAVPASHVTGLTANILLAIAMQGTLVIMGEFKVRAFLALAARERITHTVVVPAMYNLCLLQPDLESFDLRAWRVGGYGGAPMAEATIAALAARLPALQLHNVYGATETTGPVTMLPPAHAAQRPDSTGFALPGCDIVAMDAQGREVPPGASGELWIRGPMVVPGYWANPQASREGFVGGYWRSGDVGCIDVHGFVRVFDRVKDMLNRGGFKIYSVEVENVLLEHPAVVESAIVGAPCPVLGERVHAFVCLKPDVALSAAQLQHFCALRLADYKVPETFTLTHEPLPRNANGKLLKRTLREQLPAST